MLAEEVGDFGTFKSDGLIKRCFAIIIFRIHIGTFGNKEYDDFFVTVTSRVMQRSVFNLIIRRTHICTFSE